MFKTKEFDLVKKLERDVQEVSRKARDIKTIFCRLRSEADPADPWNKTANYKTLMAKTMPLYKKAKKELLSAIKELP